MLGLVGTQDIDVLVNRVGSALVPLATGALRGRQNFDELIEFAVKITPALYQVANQQIVVRLVFPTLPVGV